MMSMNLSNISININGVDYRRIIARISKNKSLKLMQNIYFSSKYRFCLIVLDDVVINDILVSNKNSFGKEKLEMPYWLFVWWL